MENLKDFWIYEETQNGVEVIFILNGIKRNKENSAQYLMSTYNLSNFDAYEYLNKLPQSTTA